MNTVQLTGRLTRDPESSQTSAGPVCRMRIAVDGMARGGDVGFVDVTSFGKPGEACARMLRKGWLVAVDGRLEQHTWTADDGGTRSALAVVGAVEFLAAPKGA